MHYKKKKKDNNLCVVHECHSIPGHPLGFSPSVSGLPNFGMLDRSPCSAVSAKKIRIPQAGALEEQHTSSGASRIRSRSTPAHPEGITRCVTSAIECILLHFNFVHESLKINERNPSWSNAQHLWKSVIKCPVTDQTAVTLVFLRCEFLFNQAFPSDKTENKQKGLLWK